MIALPGIERTTTGTSDVRLEHLFTCRIRLRFPPDAVGATPEGMQVGFSLVEGNVSGPGLHGVVRAIGSDWLSVRPDGSGELDVRVAIETADGAVISASHQQTLDWGPSGYQRALRGTLLRRDVPLRITPRFQTTDARYQWLTGTACVGLGHFSPARGDARCAFYAIKR